MNVGFKAVVIAVMGVQASAFATVVKDTWSDGAWIGGGNPITMQSVEDGALAPNGTIAFRFVGNGEYFSSFGRGYTTHTGGGGPNTFDPRGAWRLFISQGDADFQSDFRGLNRPAGWSIQVPEPSNADYLTTFYGSLSTGHQVRFAEITAEITGFSFYFQEGVAYSISLIHIRLQGTSVGVGCPQAPLSPINDMVGFGNGIVAPTFFDLPAAPTFPGQGIAARLVTTPVPSPSALVVLAGAGGVCLRRRRRVAAQV
jgi:MYXO-CTERM domain-containing protein